MPGIPTTKDVIPGALVNIVLKADQPTGRTVSGTVATLLTRGNHPSGIKVRLADGRVGRVQSMAAAAGAEPSQSATPPVVPTTLNATTSRSRYVAEMEYERPAQEAIGLDAYIAKPKHGQRGRERGRGKGANRGSSQQQSNSVIEEEQVAQVAYGSAEEVVTCPVCGNFEGDEAAVAHHVSSHFGD
ncbi:hypothetical protein BDW75DRAFT_224003 [Aspergillus navahoensis]